MLSDRAFPYRRWIEFVAWLGLGGLFLALQWLPLPDSQRLALALFFAVLAFYLFVTFHVLFPRSRYAPRVIYATLVIDIFILGVLRLLLADYLPNMELVFIPLIVIAAMISDAPGILALAIFAAIVDSVTQLRILAVPRDPPSLLALLNQGLIAGTLALTGLVVLALTKTIRRRSLESSEALEMAAKMERAARQEAERAARGWDLINAVGLAIQAEYDPARTFQVIGGELHRIELECLITLWEEPEKQLRVAFLSLPALLQRQLERLLGDSLANVRFDIAQMPKLRQALTERRGMYFSSGQELVRRYFPQVSSEVVSGIIELTGLGQHILMPLFAREHSLGFIVLWGRDLADSDLPAATELAQQIAAALERTRLFEREQKRAAQLALVSEIAEKAVDLIDTDRLYQEVTRLIVERFGYENASVFISDPGTREVTLRAHCGFAFNSGDIGFRQSWDSGLIGTAARTGKSVVVNDVRSDSRYFTPRPEQDLCRSEMSVPLKRRDETLGVLDVQSTRLQAFEAPDVVAMEALASQIAAAIEKRELFAAERKRAAQLALVSAIAERITAILDPDSLLKQVVALIQDQFGYHNVAVLTLDEPNHALGLRAVSGGYVDLFPDGYRQPLDVGLIGTAGHSGTTIVVPDVSQDARFRFPQGHVTVTGSEMSVPLKMGNRVLGVLDIQATSINAFDASDVAAMETLANQIAVALENARLYAQTKGEAEVQATLLRELSHRVKNNLATVVGLLYLGLEDETIPRQEILNETLRRVQSMAVAHTLLANSPKARIDVLELSRHIVADSVRQMTLPGHAIPFVVEGVSVEISAHRAASLALVLNELVTNALKHSGDNPEMELRLSVKMQAGQARLEFFNRSDSLPIDSYWKQRSGGLGLQLIRTLVEKDLGGTFSLSSSLDPCGVLGVVCFTPEKES